MVLTGHSGEEKHRDYQSITSMLMQPTWNIKETKWPRRLQSDPTQKDPNLMCKYHGTHGHRTEDCRELREEVSWLFNNGHLREFLSDRAKNHFRSTYANKQNDQKELQHVINIIIGWVDVAQGPMIKCTKVSIMREKRTRDYIPEETISFSDEDAKGIVDLIMMHW
nr:uncharacterized protein LOC104091590 [Nicotiana tomentosiformis]